MLAWAIALRLFLFNIMIDLQAIVLAMSDQVRFRQTSDPSKPQLSDDLTLPVTARPISHPILKNETLSAIVPSFDFYNYPAWADGAYTKKDAVLSGDSYYVAIEDIIAGEIPGESPKWLLRGSLDTFLKDKLEDATIKAFTDIINLKKSNNVLREALGDVMLYDGAGSMSDLIINKGELVGLEIKMLEDAGLEVVIRMISMQLSGAETFNMYLWHSSQIDPVATVSINYTASYSVQWSDFDQSISYRNYAQNQDNGTYFLGYYQADITQQAVRKRINLGTLPCGTCSNYNRVAYKKYSQYVSVKAFKVSSPPASLKLWDVEDTIYVTDTNWGINLRMQPNCNITDYIVERPGIFADLVEMQLTHDLLLEVANNDRDNGLTDRVTTLARNAIQPQHLGGEGIPSKLKISKEAAAVELSDIEKNVCMPESPSKGIVSSSVYG